MCGIAGIVTKFTGDSQAFQKFESSARLMNHRGPDHYGKVTQGNIGLFHYRLSILDLDARANQPFQDGVKGDALVYNGELYNYKSLKDQYHIEQTTTSDTEVLHQLFQFRQTSILPELNGIFAFAYLDNGRNQLTLVRDRFGVKPLYYYEDDRYFLFASEAKVILDFLDEIKINFQALSEFLHFSSPNSAKTVVSGLKKLEPGSYLELDLATFNTNSQKYWDIGTDVDGKKNNDSLQTAIGETRKLFDQAVQRQCISDVPVGAYLSSGLDSSAVVAYASQYTNLSTFSVEFDGSNTSELAGAREVANTFHTNHHEMKVETKNLEDDIEAIIFQYDEPFGDPAALPLHLIAKSCSDQTKVVLQGDGGDELFAGYGRHLDLSEIKLRQWAAKGFSLLAPDKQFRQRMKERSKVLNEPSHGKRMGLMVSREPKIGFSEVFHEPWKSKIERCNPFEVYEAKNAKFSKLDPMQRMLYTDFEVILPNTYLEKVDKINMLHSIEARVPFLDNDLVQYVMTLPSKYKIQKRQTKWLFREAMKDVLPKSILEGRKNSFGTPASEWLRTTLYDQVKDKFEKAKQKFPFINSNMLLNLLEEHANKKGDHTKVLWRSFVLITWLGFYEDKLALNS